MRDRWFQLRLTDKERSDWEGWSRGRGFDSVSAMVRADVNYMNEYLATNTPQFNPEGKETP